MRCGVLHLATRCVNTLFYVICPGYVRFMSIHVICAKKYNESSYKRLDCKITLYVYKIKCGWVAMNNVSLGTHKAQHGII